MSLNWSRAKESRIRNRERLNPTPFSKRKPSGLQIAYARSLGIPEKQLRAIKTMADMSAAISAAKISKSQQSKRQTVGKGSLVGVPISARPGGGVG